MTIGPSIAWTRRRPALAVAASLAVLVSGCGFDGVELNGRLFDMMGVSDAAQKNANREPKLNSRNGLVMPPDVNRLPEPGSDGTPDVTAELNDPDKRRQVAAAERARLHKLYCSGEIQWKERATSRDAAAASPQSPYGSCTLFGEALKQ